MSPFTSQASHKSNKSHDDPLLRKGQGKQNKKKKFVVGHDIPRNHPNRDIFPQTDFSPRSVTLQYYGSPSETKWASEPPDRLLNTRSWTLEQDSRPGQMSSKGSAAMGIEPMTLRVGRGRLCALPNSTRPTTC